MNIERQSATETDTETVARAAAGRGRTGARALSALARALPPPVAEADEAWRAVTGCMELPAVLRERALVLLRRRAGKERLGLRRMVAKHRPQPARQDAGLPFTRAMYSGERAPEGDDVARWSLQRSRRSRPSTARGGRHARATPSSGLRVGGTVPPIC